MEGDKGGRRECRAMPLPMASRLPHPVLYFAKQLACIALPASKGHSPWQPKKWQLGIHSEADASVDGDVLNDGEMLSAATPRAGRNMKMCTSHHAFHKSQHMAT